MQTKTREFIYRKNIVTQTELKRTPQCNTMLFDMKQMNNKTVEKQLMSGENVKSLWHESLQLNIPCHDTVAVWTLLSELYAAVDIRVEICGTIKYELDFVFHWQQFLAVQMSQLSLFMWSFSTNISLEGLNFACFNLTLSVRHSHENVNRCLEHFQTHSSVKWNSVSREKV